MHQKPRITSKTTLPLILILWPATAILVAFCIGLLSNASSSSNGNLFGDESFMQSLFNTLSITLWGGAFILGPISFVVGLVLLFKRGGN